MWIQLELAATKFQCIPKVWLLLIIPAVWLGTWNTFWKYKYSLCNDVMRILQMWNSMDGRQSVGNVWMSPLQLLSFLHSYFNCGFTEIITFTLHGSFVIHCCSFVAFHSHCKRRAYSIAYSDEEKSCNNIVFLLTRALRMHSDMHISLWIFCKTVLKEFNKVGQSIHLSWSIRSVFVLIKVKYPQSSTRALLWEVMCQSPTPLILSNPFPIPCIYPNVLPNPRSKKRKILTAKLNKHITHERGLIQCQVGK